jgi:type I restriction enzyme S subunit
VIALPPREEQEKIVEFVREVESRSRSLADNLTRSVALLRERRQSLITSAVTGELDLRIYAQKGAAE